MIAMSASGGCLIKVREVNKMLEGMRNHGYHGYRRWVGFFLHGALVASLIFSLLMLKHGTQKKYKYERDLQQQIDLEINTIHLLEVELSHLSRPQRIKEIYSRQGRLKQLSKEAIFFEKNPT